MDFQQIRDFVNPAVAQATGMQEVENLSMPVPVAYVPVQLVIDGALSLTSENPVQNKVIAVAIQNLDGRITAIEGQFSEGVTEAVNNWLAAHPEATTTVQDGAITYAKLDTNLKAEVDQITELQNAINVVETQKRVVTEFEQGTIQNGNPSYSTTRIRSGKLPIEKNSHISFVGGANAQRIAVEYYNSNGVFQSEIQGWITEWEYTVTEDCYLIFVYSRSNTTAITPSDYDATTAILLPLQAQIDKNAEEITALTDRINIHEADFESISYKTGAVIYRVFKRSHGSLINQANTQIDITIPKNWYVTLTLSDSVTQGKNTSVYVRYRGDSSSTLLPSIVSLDGGSITFITAKETQFISLYATNVNSGLLTFSFSMHILDNLVGIPSYYQDHIVSKANEIRDNMMTTGIDGETFVFISDLHWENNTRNSPVLTKYLLDNLNVNFLLCGGDLINEGTKDTMSKTMVECIRAFNFKNTFFPCAFGNHDSNKNGNNPEAQWFNENAEYALMQKQAEDKITYFTDSGWNFYFDAQQTKTRWIVCDTQENGTFTWYDELCTLLNETPEGYHIIIAGHWFYNSGAKSTFAVNLESIIDAFNEGSSAVVNSNTYSFNNPPIANIPFVIGGHMHNDMNWTTPAGIPFILIDCDNGPRSCNTDYPYVKGTITEQCFDVVTVDYTNKTIKCVRIGRGANRTFSY